MSSGYNGIPIRGKVGNIRERLAELITEATGWPINPEDLRRSNPQVQHYEDTCAWSVWTKNAKGWPVHAFSWYNMTKCVRNGITVDFEKNSQTECEVFPKSDPKPTV